jgi:hypothetical protein
MQQYFEGSAAILMPLCNYNSWLVPLFSVLDEVLLEMKLVLSQMYMHPS